MHSVSIAMATYNGEHYIREQLDSLAGQSLSPTELVITDDCSMMESYIPLCFCKKCAISGPDFQEQDKAWISSQFYVCCIVMQVGLNRVLRSG